MNIEPKPAIKFSVFAEFPTLERAEQALSDICWMQFNSLNSSLAGCQRHSNPHVIEIWVNSLDPARIRTLGSEIGAARITCDNKEIYPSPPPPKDAAVLFYSKNV